MKTAPNIIEWTTTALKFVSPERNVPGGMVRSTPGLSNKNSKLGTIRSALVNVIPVTLAIVQYKGTNNAARVATLSNEKVIGLSTKNRTTGISTLTLITISNYLRWMGAGVPVRKVIDKFTKIRKRCIGK